jgi:2-polyprenyl-3-methyl-5-hydroxy-6-metoxy-1,4-benzoquinol methylase
MTSDDAYYSHLKEGELPGHATYITATYAINICRLYGTSTGTWMDVGCGSGHLLSRARDNGYAVIGIEPGGWGQLAAAEKQLNIIRGFLTKKTFGERFAVVSATDVIEHVSDPVGFLRILRHYINVNGVLVFSIPFSDSFERRVLGTKWNMVEPPTHSQFFSRLSLTTALEKAGLRLIRSRQFSVRPFFGLGNISWIRSGIDALFDGPQIVAIAKPI